MAEQKKYIVTGKHGAMELNHDWVPEGSYKGALCYSGKATVFNSYAAAKGAINRTVKYEEERGYNWETWRLKPVQLKFQ